MIVLYSVFSGLIYEFHTGELQHVNGGSGRSDLV